VIPLWLKIAYTAMVAVIVVVYWIKYGPGNFLWFSDVALLVAVPALWLESSVLASAMAVGVLVPELFWNVAYFTRLLAGRRLSGLTDYMFDPSLPRYLRALSLFHVVLPVLLLWMVGTLGYAPAALLVQIAVAWIVLPLCYALTDPKENVNWVFGWGGAGEKTRLPPLRYLAILMVALPVLLYVPTHFVLRMLFPATDGPG
jgi:hypothetical protein